MDNVTPRRYGLLKENCNVRHRIPLYELLVKETPKGSKTTQAITITLVYLVRVSIAVTKHLHQKPSWRGKGLFSLYFSIAVHHSRKSGQELKHSRILEAGANAKAMEGSCLLA